MKVVFNAYSGILGIAFSDKRTGTISGYCNGIVCFANTSLSVDCPGKSSDNTTVGSLDCACSIDIVKVNFIV